MRVIIEFDTDNAAFTDEPDIEIGRVLASAAVKLAQHFDEPDYCAKLRDSNGNTIGKVEVRS